MPRRPGDAAITRTRPRSRTLCASLTNAQMPERPHPPSFRFAAPPIARGPARVARGAPTR
ncbi:hypothetical protein [Lysobacter gummosus]|uniref:hypothetical protein n=1 Tax=Lysobacter gummosus TaxID=262324 RepID=UPI003638269D